MEQRTSAWFDARKGRITASSVGAILGLAPYATRADVMRRMVREALSAANEFDGNIATKYGVNNESGALIEFEMETGQTVTPVGFVTREDWGGCSPDGLIGDEYGLEIKCPFSLRKDDAPQFKTLADQPHYFAQVQFSLWITGRLAWYFFQWSPKGTACESVSSCDEWQAENMPILRQFYAEYLHEVEHNAAQHLAPKRADIDTPEAHRIMAEYEQMQEAEERAKERKAELIAEMVRIAGDKNAVFAGRNLTRVDRQGSISYAKAIKELLPKADLEPYRGKASFSWQVK
jgi:putative phage-type endonuclease